MSAGLLDDLLAGLIAPTGAALAPPTPAKSANSAKREHSCGLGSASSVCEGSRIPANPAPDDGRDNAGSRTFAAVHKPEIGPQGQQSCGSSQNSQPSQGIALHCTPAGAHKSLDGVWTDADIARFNERRARFMRWGWPESDAETMADRLVRRDRDADDRVCCADCSHYRPGHCDNYRRAGLSVAEVGRDLAAMPQRCPGFAAPESRLCKGRRSKGAEIGITTATSLFRPSEEFDA